MGHWKNMKKFVCLLVFLLIGCSGANKVTGKIAFGDKKLPEGTQLRFDSVTGKINSVTTITDKDGNFTINIRPGKYMVVLLAPKGDNGEFYKSIPKEYYDGGNLPVEVKDQPLNLVVKK